MILFLFIAFTISAVILLVKVHLELKEFEALLCVDTVTPRDWLLDRSAKKLFWLFVSLGLLIIAIVGSAVWSIL